MKLHPSTLQYADHGYQIFSDILSAAWLKTALQVTESAIEYYRDTGPLTNEQGVSLGEFAQSSPHRNPGIDGSTLMNEPYIIGDLLTVDRRFISLLAEPILWSTAANLLATEPQHIIFHYANITRKPAHIGPSIAWHRDGENTYFCPEDNHFLRLLIPLQGMSQENGGTAVVAGSHIDSNIDKTTLDESLAIHPELQAGDLLAIHPQLLHGGAPNRSNKERDVLIIQFGIADAKFRHQEMLELGSLHRHHTFLQL